MTALKRAKSRARKLTGRAAKTMVTRVPAPSGSKVISVRYCAPCDAASTTNRRGASNPVTHISSVAGRPIMVRASRQRLPSPTGPSVNTSTLSMPDTFAARLWRSVAIRNTRSGGAAMVL